MRALAHAKAKIVRLQQLAAQARPRSRVSAAASGADQPPPDRLSALSPPARRAAARAIAALDPGEDNRDGLWPWLEASATEPRSGPILVAAGSNGAAMAGNLRDPRILVGCAQDMPEPDLLLIPKADKPGEVARIFSQLPAGLLGRLACGRTKLLLDACLEGTFQNSAYTAELHGLLEARGVSPRHVVYLTQDRGYRAGYERHCLGARLIPMHVWIYDYYAQSLFRSLEQNGAQMFEEGLERWRRLGPSRARRFLSMNFHPRPTKLLFLLRLLKDGLWDQALISFAGFDWLRARGEKPEDLVQALLASPEFAAAVRPCLPWLADLERSGAMLLGANGSTDPKSVDRFETIDLEEYGQTWFSVVAETEMGKRVHRITEKPFKPLLNFHPLLVLGNPGSLRLVRAYGFETFAGLFDESYDEESDPARRFEMVYGQVLALCRLEEPALAAMIAEASDRLVFNARWGLTELPGLYRRRIDQEMVSRLVAFAGDAEAMSAS